MHARAARHDTHTHTHVATGAAARSPLTPALSGVAHPPTHSAAASGLSSHLKRVSRLVPSVPSLRRAAAVRREASGPPCGWLALRSCGVQRICRGAVRCVRVCVCGRCQACCCPRRVQTCSRSCTPAQRPLARPTHAAQQHSTAWDSPPAPLHARSPQPACLTCTCVTMSCVRSLHFSYSATQPSVSRRKPGGGMGRVLGV
jgi:hypothetical protein